MTKRGRKSFTYLYKGKPHTLQELARMAGMTKPAMYARLHYYGHTVEQAVEQPRSLNGKPAVRHTFAGKCLTLREWAEVVGVSASSIGQRLRFGWTIEQALTTPTPQQRKRGVVSNFEAFEGTGAGSIAREISEIIFSKQEDNE